MHYTKKEPYGKYVKNWIIYKSYEEQHHAVSDRLWGVVSIPRVLTVGCPSAGYCACRLVTDCYQPTNQKVN
jgi:hypothetical protein